MDYKTIHELILHTPLEQLSARADRVCQAGYRQQVFLRGLLEFSNYCRCNCLYCGIRRDNRAVRRYRMSEEEILAAVSEGFARGLRSFVLQSGEDNYYTTDKLSRLLARIKEQTNGQAAVTLSCGVKSLAAYRQLKSWGMDRYLLRFETSDPRLHRYLRAGQALQRRLQALDDLRSAGLEVGTGFMVGLPGETEECRIRNLLLCRELEPDMVGIGPFLPHPDTPLRDSPVLAFEVTVRMTAVLRLLLPGSNIPATTASGSLQPQGREVLLGAGANVLMPNITPVALKKHYLLYPNKICLSESGFECLACLERRVGTVGKTLSYEVGTSLAWRKRQANGQCKTAVNTINDKGKTQ